jgi:hypothetical protein
MTMLFYRHPCEMFGEQWTYSEGWRCPDCGRPVPDAQVDWLSGVCDCGCEWDVEYPDE